MALTESEQMGARCVDCGAAFIVCRCDDVEDYNAMLDAEEVLAEYATMWPGELDR